MKRRFISFLSAVVVACMAFAQTSGIVVYSWESPEGTVIETGGTAVEVNGTDAAKPRVNYANAGYYTICLNGKKANINDEAGATTATHALITLDEALQEGDSIYVTAYRNKGTGAASSIYFLYENGTEVSDDKEYGDIAVEGETPTTHGYLIPTAAAGSKTIRLTRNASSTNLFITKFVIVRQAAEEDTPVESVVYTMVQNEADLVAGGKYLIMAEVDGGWVALSDQSGTIRVPSDTLSVTESWTVETTVATAVAESPALFAGAAYELTLEGEAGAWKFKDELNGAYLHWTSGNSIANDAEGSAWTIAFNQYAHNAVIAHATTTARILQYNASSPRFCAYTSTQKPVYLFKAGEVTVAPEAPSNPTFASIADLLAFDEGYVVELSLDKAKITYCSGNNMSITDGTDTLAIYDYNIPSDYVVAGKLSGTIIGAFTSHKGNQQLATVDWSQVTYTAPVTVESPWVGAVADTLATYYFYNPEAKAFLKAGNSWGTRASFGQDAYPIILEGADNVYALSTTLAFAGKGLRASDLFMDQSLDKYTFEEVGDGIYTFSSGGKYVAYTGVNTVEYAAELNEGCYWQLLTADVIKEQMLVADATTPYDVTALVPGANFGRNNAQNSSWVTENVANYSNAGGANNGDNNNQQVWNAGLSKISQVLTDMPNGTYKLNAQAFYRLGGVAEAAAARADGTEVYDVKLFANSDSVLVKSVMEEAGKLDVGSDYGSYGKAPDSQSQARDFFTAGYYDHELYVIVSDGTINIGVVKNTSVAADWLVFDNFRLTYYGTATVEEIELAKLQEYIDEVTALVAAAKAIEATYSEGAKTELDAAVAAGEAALAAPTKEGLVAAVAPLEAAIARAERSVAINAVAGTATLNAPVAFTQFVTNPDMAGGNIDGWTVTSGWQFQQNQVYTGAGAELNKFQERWQWGAGLGNTSTMQALVDMPDGIYRISAHIMATAQYAEDAKGHVTGAYWVANNDSVAVATGNGVPEAYAVDVEVAGGVLNIGLVGVNTTANWMGIDNVTVTYYGTECSLEQLAKIDAFLARYAEFEALQENGLNYSWYMINQTYYMSVQNEAYELKADIANVTDLAELDAMMAKMDEAEAQLAEAYAVGDEYNKIKALYMEACDKSVPMTDEVKTESESTYEWLSMGMAGYTISTIEDLTAAVAELKTKYLAYISNAWGKEEGVTFDVTFMAGLTTRAGSSYDAATDAWSASEYATAAPEVTTADGRTSLMIQYNTRVGREKLNSVVMQQTVWNLPNATYNVELYANALNNNYEVALTDGDNTLVYVSANDVKTPVVAKNATTIEESDVYAINGAVVTDDSLHLTLSKNGVDGTNWHTVQIKSISLVAPMQPVVETGKKVVLDLNVEREAGLGYADEWYYVSQDTITALLGVDAFEGASVWGVAPDGSFVEGAMAAYDGWRDAQGAFTTWGSTTEAVCVKIYDDEEALGNYWIMLCTDGWHGNDPVAGTEYTASWALISGNDTVVLNTNITFVEPVIQNISEFDVVSTIKVEHNETVGVTYSGATASFDPVSTAAALGVASLADAEQYILNVTTGNLVANTTDGWRDANGDAAGWGAEGGVCVKINDPASGTIDYIGCIDTTHEAGEVYTAKWAFVHEGKAVVIEVVITFVVEDGIENIEAADNAVIYTITGKRVEGNVKSLESGIYIVNGKKVFVK